MAGDYVNGHAKDFNTLESFLARKLPPKEALIESILYQRDLATVQARRRHGKTSLVCQEAIAGASEDRFLGYRIPKPFRTLLILLEGDDTELQDMLRVMKADRKIEGRVSIITRYELMDQNIHPVIANPRGKFNEEFCTYISKRCEEHRPDLVTMDNLGMLIGGSYRDGGGLVDLVIQYQYKLMREFGVAVQTLAHPRKRTDEEDGPSLKDDPEAFFEETMGSSHFINSTGSLWGMQRNWDSGTTDFLAGAQRAAGTESLCVLSFDRATNWFSLTDDVHQRYATACQTRKRKDAWHSLPDTPFSFSEGVAAAGMSKSSFNEWLKDSLIRQGLITHNGDFYQKAADAARIQPPGPYADVIGV